MGTIRTGITSGAVARYLRGPGQLRRDFVSMESLGDAIGETRGGTSFSYGLVFHDVEPDGAPGLIVGHRFIDKIVPTLTVNLLEHTVSEHLHYLPGATSADQKPTGVKGEYLGTGSDMVLGVAPTGTPAIDESTLEVWKTLEALTSVATKLTLDSHYKIVDQVRIASVVATDTITIGGVEFLGDDTPVQADGEFDTSGTDAEATTSLAALINSAYGVPNVTAVVADNTLISLTRAVAGTKNVITETGSFTTLTYQVVQEITGSMTDADFITAFYTYDVTASGDTFTIIKPGQIEAADHFTNIALLTEISDVDQTYPAVFIIKKPLSEPDTIEIPGERTNETVLKMTWKGYFDPGVGLAVANAPVELWLPYGI